MSDRRGRWILAVATVMVAGAAGAGEARAADGATALGIELPPLEVELPAVEVTLPPLEVNLAPVQVKVPSVEVRLPSAGVNLPAVEVELPPPEVETPQVEAPASATPRTPAGTQAAPASTPAPGKKATARETAQAASGDSAASGTAARGGSGARRRDAASPTRSTAVDPHRKAAVPPAIRQRERRLRRLVRSLPGCMEALRSFQTRVLTLRAGGAARPPLTRRQVARRLDVGLRRIAAVERRGLERLRAHARAGGCAREPAPDDAAVPAGTGKRLAPPASTTTVASPPPRRAPRDRVGVVEVVARSLGGGVAPHLAPSVLLIRASSPPLLVLLIGGFLVGFVVVWVRESGIWRPARQPT